MKKFTFLFLAVLFFGFVNNTSAQIKVGGQVGVALPMGDFGDIASTGFGFNGLFVYQIQPQLEITGLLGYTTFGSKTTELYGDYSFSMVPLLGGIRYSFSEPEEGKVAPYAGAEIGLQFTSASYEVEYFGFRSEGSVSSSEFCFAPQVGLYFPINEQINLDANVKFNVISDANYLGINAGIVYILP